MFSFLANTFHGIGNLFEKKMPRALGGPQFSGPAGGKFGRPPTANELLTEIKGTAWTCASMNAQQCAAYPPKLYVTTSKSQPEPKCPTRPVSQKTLRHLQSRKEYGGRLTNSAQTQEVTSHPLLDLFRQVNPVHNAFDLWELTTLYQEVHGSTFWYLDLDPVLGIPREIWVMPSQNMTPKRDPGSMNLVDYYEYRSGKEEQRFAPNTIIHFRYPDPRDPYTQGLSPLKACFEQVTLTSEYAAFRVQKFQNHAIPDAILSPEESIGDEERARLEVDWTNRLRRGGSGRVIVAEQKMRLDIMAHSMGDIAALADMQATKELIMNAFHVPVAYFSSYTNLANLAASRAQHAEQAIHPRLCRRDEKINEQLIPLYDPSDRLFVASDDPLPPDGTTEMERRKNDIMSGVKTINQVRSEDGLEPVEWGHFPWFGMGKRQADKLMKADLWEKDPSRDETAAGKRDSSGDELGEE